jgi:hypothetical protein
MKNALLALSGISLSLFIISCGSEPKINNAEQKTESKEDVKPEIENDDLANFEFHVLIANMPKPLEELSDLNLDHVSFNKEMMCPLEAAEKHASVASIALNCGLYMADLTYQTVYHKKEDLIAYLTVAHDLAGKCGTEYAFNKVLRSGLEENMDNKDSLQAIIERGYETMEEYLLKENRIETATQLLTGGWIETQYLMMLSLQQMPEPTKHLKYHVFEQRVHLERLLKLLSEFKDEAGLKAEHTKLVTLEESFLKIHATEDVSHELLTELANEIEEIRNDIIGM